MPDEAPHPPQLAFLDHVYGVVDAITADAIARCGEVCGVHLDVLGSDVAAAAPLLEAAGFVVTRSGDVWSVTDTQMTLTLTEGAADASGLRRIEFTLDSPTASSQVETIGRSRLTVGPGRGAVWDFGG